MTRFFLLHVSIRQTSPVGLARGTHIAIHHDDKEVVSHCKDCLKCIMASVSPFFSCRSLPMQHGLSHVTHFALDF